MPFWKFHNRLHLNQLFIIWPGNHFVKGSARRDGRSFFPGPEAAGADGGRCELR